MKLLFVMRNLCPFLCGFFCGFTLQDAYAINIQGRSGMSFGTVSAPPSGSVSITVDVNDNVSGSALLISGTPSHGGFRVKGQKKNETTISIDVQPVNNVPGLTLGSFTAVYDGATVSLPVSGHTPPSNIWRDLDLGATLTISSSVASGDHQPQFDINVNYE